MSAKIASTGFMSAARIVGEYHIREDCFRLTKADGDTVYVCESCMENHMSCPHCDSLIDICEDGTCPECGAVIEEKEEVETA